MDEKECDEKKPSSNTFGVSLEHDYGSSNRMKVSVRNTLYQHGSSGSGSNNLYTDSEDEEDVEEVAEEEDSDGEDSNGVQRVEYAEGDGVQGSAKSEKRSIYRRKIEDIDFEKHPKKRKLRALISNFEFAPRVALQSSTQPVNSKQSSGGRSLHLDWTEHETFVLLDAWGDCFLQNGRKSLRSEEWLEVAEKVCRESKMRRTDTQCRNRLDTLKKKYKKEKSLLNTASRWIYFKKVDVLMSTPPQQASLARGESGRYLFRNSAVSNTKNLSESDDVSSSAILGSTKGKTNRPYELPLRKRSSVEINDEDTWFKLMTDCMHQICSAYKSLEQDQRHQMKELEKMRIEFHKDLERHKSQILESARQEIAKMLQDDEDNGASTGKISR